MSGSTKQVEDNVALPLKAELIQQIRKAGQITFRDWMEAALYHPTFGYYSRTDLQRWGREGDYRTSPERSELFAATFARYFANLFRRLNEPAQLAIIEMGAGNGRFASGVLSALQQFFPAVFDATRYFLCDRSRDALARASDELQTFSNQVELVNAAELRSVPAGIIFSNELLDSFPVHRVTIVGGQFRELFVTLDNESNFIWRAYKPSTDSLELFCNENIPRLGEGQVAEVNLAIDDWYKTITRLLESGFVITVDYGAEAKELYSGQRKEGTLRAFQRHKFVENILEAPGENDITSSVNWTYVKKAGARYGFKQERFERLDKFLIEEGILDELETRLSQSQDDVEKAHLTIAAREMILPGGMASSFQVLIQKR